MKKATVILLAFVLMCSFIGCRKSTESTSFFTYGSDEATGAENSAYNTDSSGSDNQTSTSQDGGEGQGSTGTKVGDKTHTIKNPMAVDLKGATISVYSVFDETFNANSSESKQAKAQVELLKKLEKELNCKVVPKMSTIENIQGQVSGSAAAGKALCSILNVPVYNVSYYSVNKLVTSLSNISTVDLSYDYMNRYRVGTNSELNGKSYAIATGDLGITFGVFFNKRILTELGKSEDYIYSLIKNGKWNISNYRDLAKSAMKDLDGKTGYSGEDQWGQVCIGFENLTPKSAMASLNTSMLKLENGKLKYNMDDPNVLKALNIAYEYTVSDATMYRDITTDADKYNFFANGKALFFQSYVSYAPEIAGMKDDFGFAPMPKVDSASNYNASMPFNTGTFMILNNLSKTDRENAGAFVQAYCYSYENVLKTAESEYTNRYFCDSTSGENMILANSCQVIYPEDLYGKIGAIQQGTLFPMWNYFNKSEALATAIAATKSATVKGIEEFNEKYK